MQVNNKSSKPRIQVTVENGRVVGWVEGDTFHKTIYGSKHLLRVPPAIAFDIYSLDLAEKFGGIKVQILDEETGTIYKSSIKQIREYGKNFNRGYGDQIYLVLGSWSIYKSGDFLQLPLFQGI